MPYVHTAAAVAFQGKLHADLHERFAGHAAAVFTHIDRVRQKSAHAEARQNEILAVHAVGKGKQDEGFLL